MRPVLQHMACVLGAAFCMALPRVARAGCHQIGVASSPFIGRADMAAIDRAVVTLPAVRRKTVTLTVGKVMPRELHPAPVPAAVKKVLPQYAGYKAFRTGHQVVIIKPDSRRLVYILPLRGAPTYNCP